MQTEAIIEIEGQLTIDILETGKTIYMPLQLQYCNQEQYINMCELIYNLETGKIDIEEFKTFAVYKLLNLKVGKRKINQELTFEALDNIRSISEYISDYFNVNEDNSLSIKLNYTKNHIISVKPNLKKYFGPKDYFTKTTFGEYEEGLNLFLEYNQTKEEHLLVRLFAIFYRERKQSYEPENLEKHIKFFKKLPIGVLYGFYYTFASFHTYFTSSEVYWEGKLIDMSIIFTEQSEDKQEPKIDSPYPSLGMKSIAYQLAESGVFGSLTDVRKTNLWEVALRLYDIRKRDLDNKTLLEQQNKKTS